MNTFKLLTDLFDDTQCCLMLLIILNMFSSNILYSEELNELPLKFTPIDQRIEKIAYTHSGKNDVIYRELLKLEDQARNSNLEDLSYILAYQCYLVNSLGQKDELEKVMHSIRQLTSSNLRNRSVQATNNFCRAYSYYFQENYDDYNLQMELAYQHARKADSVVLRYWISFVFAGIAKDASRHNDALEASHLALSIAIANNDEYREADTRGAMAISEAELKFTDDALANNQKAIDFYTEKYGEKSVLILLMNRGYILIGINQLDEAQQLYEKAIKIAVEDNNQYQVISMQTNLAAIAYRKDDYERVIELCEKIYEYSKTVSDKDLEAHANSIGAIAYAKLVNMELGRKKVKASIAYFEETKQLNALSDTLDGWAYFMAQEGNYKEAYETELEYKALQKKLFLSQRDSKTSILKETLKSVEKDREIVSLSTQAVQQQSEIEKATLKSRNWWLTAMLLTVSGLLLFLMYKRLRERATKLEKMNAKLDKQRYTDPLTKTFNRRFLDESLTQQISIHVKDSQANVGLFILDIDHFKVINDTYGHATGDVVLIEFVNRIKQRLRSDDKVVRLGGEEFLVVVLGGENESYEFVADKLLKTIADMPFETSEGSLSITTSVGVSRVDSDSLGSMSVVELIELADKALYCAKDSGRNCAVIADIKSDTSNLETVQEAIDNNIVNWRKIE